MPSTIGIVCEADASIDAVWSFDVFVHIAPGDQAGYRSYVYFDPAASTGVILVFNTTNDNGVGDPEMAALSREALTALRR